jgi:DNA repair protein RadD
MLRDYQARVDAEITTAFSAGADDVLAVMPTGAGKTVLFSHRIVNADGPAGAIAHRSELVAQISMALARNGVRHRIIGSPALARNAVAMHMAELGKSFYDPSARNWAAGVDTLVRLDPNDRLFSESVLVVNDEGHHLLRENKWGKARQMFKRAKGLAVTATPGRPDGRGLGRHADGLIDVMVMGPGMRELIDRKYLTPYRVLCPPSDLDLTNVPVGSGGDFQHDALRAATHKSHIVGDVVQHYLKYTPGKLGMTFAVDIESAQNIAAAFEQAGVPAIAVDGKMSDLERSTAMRKFRTGQIKQLVSVDLMGEGVDVPALEVVSFARATQSVIVYMQQFGRALRLMDGKSHAWVLDHVGNVLRHRPPDAFREWSLDRRDKRKKPDVNEIPLRVCPNENANGTGLACASPYERALPCCPYCGFKPEPSLRGAPEQVDGDLLELDEAVLAAMRGEIARVDGPVRIPQNVDQIVARAITNKHNERQEQQRELRAAIAQWAGYQKWYGRSDAEIYRRFYFTYGMDIMTAQTLGAREATELAARINTGMLEVTA